MSETSTGPVYNQIPRLPRERKLSPKTYDALAKTARDFIISGDKRAVTTTNSFLIDRPNVEATPDTEVGSGRYRDRTEGVQVAEHSGVEDLLPARQYVKRSSILDETVEAPLTQELAVVAREGIHADNLVQLPSLRILFAKDDPAVRFTGEVRLFDDAQRGEISLECFGTERREDLIDEAKAFAESLGLGTIWQRYMGTQLGDFGTYDSELGDAMARSLTKAITAPPEPTV